VSRFAIENCQLEYIQKEKRGTSVVDNQLYKLYVPLAVFETIAFSAWPWAIVPTLSNIEWSFKSLRFFNTFGSFLLSLLLYDFIYFAGHFMMHKDPIYYKNIHKVHHQITSPGDVCDNLYIHPLELFIFLWPQVLPIYVIPMHIITVWAYFFTIYAVTSMYHNGIKFPSFLPMLSPEFHDDHHRLNNVNFSFFTEIPDYIFRTKVLKTE
jgi:sterol desaturase/sphingolipid hydroxylase (fatty acid hydroxylase superfamily)